MTNKNTKAFTLVEIMIVVAILGILAAIVYPEYQNHIVEAREAAAKDSLRIFRNTIELYITQHENTPPGYLNGNTSTNPSYPIMLKQLTLPTNAKSEFVATRDAEHQLGPYLSDMPENPFNGGKMVHFLTAAEAFPTSAVTSAGGTIGWIFKPSTRQIRLNTFGSDSEGVSFQTY